MENEPDQVSQQHNPEYQEQFQKQADIYNEQEKADYQKANEERSLAEKFIFRKPEGPQGITAVDMAHEEALTVDSVVNKAIEDGSDDTPQEIAETVLTSQEFGLKTPEELKRRERLLRDGAEVVAKVYSADIDDSWKELDNATKNMSPEDAIQMRIALRELVSDYIATCIKAGDTEDLTKIALENSIQSVGGVKSYKDFPREIINLEAFRVKLREYIEEPTKSYNAESLRTAIPFIRANVEAVKEAQLMSEEQIQAVIEGETIQGYCTAGIEEPTKSYNAESLRTAIPFIRANVEAVKEAQLMSEEQIQAVIEGETIQGYCTAGIEEPTKSYNAESLRTAIPFIRANVEAVKEAQLMSEDQIQAVIEGETIQGYCTAGIEEPTKSYNAESLRTAVSFIRANAEAVKEAQLMSEEQIQAVIEGETIQGYCTAGIEEPTKSYNAESLRTAVSFIRANAEAVKEAQLMSEEQIQAVIEGETIQGYCTAGIEEPTKSYNAESLRTAIPFIRANVEAVKEAQLMSEDQIQAVIEGETIQGYCTAGIEEPTKSYNAESLRTAVSFIRANAEAVKQQLLMSEARADAIARAAIDSMRR
jgi:predicted nuclease with RNAse H fold